MIKTYAETLINWHQRDSELINEFSNDKYTFVASGKNMEKYINRNYCFMIN